MPKGKMPSKGNMPPKGMPPKKGEGMMGGMPPSHAHMTPAEHKKAMEKKAKY